MMVFALKLTENRMLKHATPTAVAWSAIRRGKKYFWSPDRPTEIRLPFDADVRIRLGASFAPHEAGMRQAWITKNHKKREPFFGYPTPTACAVGEGSSTSLSACSPLVRHQKGDVFEMFVYQTSGKSLALRGALATWIEFEIHPIRFSWLRRVLHYVIHIIIHRKRPLSRGA